MKFRLRNVIISAIIAVCAFAAEAQVVPIDFKLIPEQSHIKFEASQAGSAVRGEFKSFEAEVYFHPEALEQSKARVEIDMASFTVDSEDAKSVLAAPEWFNVGLFPKAVFETASFKELGGNKYQAEGVLDLKGHKQPVQLDFTLDNFSENAAHITGEVVLRRKDFNVGEESTDSVRDEVVVRVEMGVVR